MTSRRIMRLDPPINDCLERCRPKYCTQWARPECIRSEEQGLSCGLCRDEEGFMKPGSCYACVLTSTRPRPVIVNKQRKKGGCRWKEIA